MRNHAPLAAAALSPAGLAGEALEGVKCAADLEGADTLEVLAFKPEADPGVSRGPLLPPGASGSSRRSIDELPRRARELGGIPLPRGQRVQRRVAHRGCPVHVRAHQVVGRDHRGPG